MTTLCCTASATRWHTQSVTLKPFNRLLQSSAVVMHFADFRFDNSSLHALPVEFVPHDSSSHRGRSKALVGRQSSQSL